MCRREYGGRDTLQGDSTSLRSVPALPIVSCVPATRGNLYPTGPSPYLAGVHKPPGRVSLIETVKEKIDLKL